MFKLLPLARSYRVGECSLRAQLLKVWSGDQQHQHLLELVRAADSPARPRAAQSESAF